MINVENQKTWLSHFTSMFHFYTLWKRQKAEGIRGTEMEHCCEMDL